MALRRSRHHTRRAAHAASRSAVRRRRAGRPGGGRQEPAGQRGPRRRRRGWRGARSGGRHAGGTHRAVLGDHPPGPHPRARTARPDRPAAAVPGGAPADPGQRAPRPPRGRHQPARRGVAVVDHPAARGRRAVPHRHGARRRRAVPGGRCDGARLRPAAVEHRRARPAPMSRTSPRRWSAGGSTRPPPPISGSAPSATRCTCASCCSGRWRRPTPVPASTARSTCASTPAATPASPSWSPSGSAASIPAWGRPCR